MIFCSICYCNADSSVYKDVHNKLLDHVHSGAETSTKPLTRRGNSKGEETCCVCVESPVRWGYAIAMESEKNYQKCHELCEKYEHIRANNEQVKANFERINANCEQMKPTYEQIHAKYEQVHGKYEQVCAKYDQLHAKYEQVHANMITSMRPRSQDLFPGQGEDPANEVDIHAKYEHIHAKYDQVHAKYEQVHARYDHVHAIHV